jgi:hypothetical protein
MVGIYGHTCMSRLATCGSFEDRVQFVWDIGLDHLEVDLLHDDHVEWSKALENCLHLLSERLKF